MAYEEKRILWVERTEVPPPACLSDTGRILASCKSADLIQQVQEQGADIVVIDGGSVHNASQLCRKLKQDQRLQGLLVLLLLAEEARPGAALECGADDFLQAPFTSEALRAKVALLLRQHAVHQMLQASHFRIEQEIRLSRHMFETIVRRQRQQLEYLDCWSLSAGHFSGDLFIYERAPDGRLHALLADFTGHGLSAAVGALPASDAFFAMTRKGLSLREIVTEINRKLHDLLPTGMFCAAIMIAIDRDHTQLEVWNGGVPALYLFDHQHRVCAQAASRNLPLGILAAGKFFAQTEVFDLAPVDVIVMCSDGLTEAYGPAGTMYGETRLVQAVGKSGQGNVLNRVKSDVLDFLDGLEPHDDVTLVAIETQGEGSHG